MAWWFVYFRLKQRDDKLAKEHPQKYNLTDYSIVSVLMILNGICLLSMFAIVNPAVDKSFASEMTIGTIGGCIALLLLSRIDYVDFYTKHYSLRLPNKFHHINKFIGKIEDGTKSVIKKLLPNKYKDSVHRFITVARNSNTIPSGIGFLSISFLLVIALALFGMHCEGVGLSSVLYQAPHSN